MNHIFNKDDVFFRNVSVGLLDLLNNNIIINYVFSEDNIKKIPVPFFYNLSGDQQFLMEFYGISENPDCFIAEGNNDSIPRGIIDLENININSASLNNKFVRGSYVKEIEGEIKTFNSYLMNIPLDLTYDVSILCDNKLEGFKIIEKIIDVFYKVKKFNVKWKGFRIPCLAGFPESYNINKLLEFSHDDDQNPKIEFKIELQTNKYVTDPKTERFRGNLMQGGINSSIKIGKNSSNIDEKLGSDPSAPYGRDENGNPIKKGKSL